MSRLTAAPSGAHDARIDLWRLRCTAGPTDRAVQSRWAGYVALRWTLWTPPAGRSGRELPLKERPRLQGCTPPCIGLRGLASLLLRLVVVLIVLIVLISRLRIAVLIISRRLRLEP